jgi:hypothetical protein
MGELFSAKRSAPNAKEAHLISFAYDKYAGAAALTLLKWRCSITSLAINIHFSFWIDSMDLGGEIIRLCTKQQDIYERPLARMVQLNIYQEHMHSPKSCG